jgi:pyruvate formate lyase activating enzyme
MEMRSSPSGVVFNIQRFSIHDGPGIRTTVFLKGCPLSCRWCHNPEGQCPEPEAYIDSDRGTPSQPVGWVARVEDVMAEIEQDVLFYEESGGGVTFSGGEPLLQYQFLMALLQECRGRELHTALDTTGYAPETRFVQVMPWTDLILYDLKIMDEEAHIRYTGVSNKIILDNLRQLSKNDGLITIRFPVIPGVNDSQENIQQMIGFLIQLDTVSHIQLLPYHKTAVVKYHRLRNDINWKLFNVPSEEQISRISDMFSSAGFTVSQGDYEI